MPESYHCDCGRDEWEIFNGLIRCTKCRAEYGFEPIKGSDSYVLPSPKEFNIHKSEMNQ